MEHEDERIRDELREIRLIAMETPSLIGRTVPAIVVDMQTQRIAFATQPADDLFGYIEGSLLGLSLEKLIPERFRERHREHFAKFVACPAKRNMGAMNMELFGLSRDGTEFPISIGLHPIVIGGRPCVIATILRTVGTRVKETA